MKKFIVLGLLFILCFSIVKDSYGAAAKKKKPKKPAVTTTTDASASNTTPPAPVVDNTPKQEEKKEVPPPDYIVLGDTTNPKDTVHYSMKKLTADSTIADVPKFQLDTSRPNDGFYKTTTLKGGKPFQFPDEKIENVKKYKRLTREIDLHDSVNAIFRVPGETLIEAIMKSIQAGKLIPYKDPSFTHPMSYQAAMSAVMGGDSVKVPKLDPETGAVIEGEFKKVVNTFNPDSIMKFEIVEDIYFDKVRGRLIDEIISFAVLSVYKNDKGEVQEGVYTHPFYLYFKQLRKLLAAKEVTDLTRDISNISYDDIFISRNFHSKITIDWNPAGTTIASKFKTEEEQKKESERIEQEIRNFRRGMFKYY